MDLVDEISFLTDPSSHLVFFVPWPSVQHTRSKLITPPPHTHTHTHTFVLGAGPRVKVALRHTCVVLRMRRLIWHMHEAEEVGS